MTKKTAFWIFMIVMPKLRGIEVYDASRGKIAFWTMSSAMMMMAITFGIAGVLQSYLERVLGMGYMTAQSYMTLWMQVTLVLGAIFFIGLVIMVTDLFTLRPAKRSS
jgi:nitric oxide reductase subunit B